MLIWFYRPPAEEEVTDRSAVRVVDMHPWVAEPAAPRFETDRHTAVLWGASRRYAVSAQPVSQGLAGDPRRPVRPEILSVLAWSGLRVLPAGFCRKLEVSAGRQRSHEPADLPPAHFAFRRPGSSRSAVPGQRLGRSCERERPPACRQPPATSFRVWAAAVIPTVPTASR